ncbi:olfactory receptor 2AT4-like [Neoarius graeffei]|uniref:olfactory receptor 2AT4-like n=1 Tax=Neoarius graeffei TaxID=443677 RepID=UPI00298D5595|nr:olfactory receptor 2AT4-like [Neoarius graeffei]
MPQHPLSHIALDVITDLPESQGNTTILGIIDHFSYYLHLIPLPGLPTTFETAKLLFDNVFRCFSIPKGIVSNRGVQFTSRVWKKFNEKPRVFVSLTSSCHPQANGQMEHANQEIGCFLKTVCADNQSSSPPFPWNISPTGSPTVDDWFRKYGIACTSAWNKQSPKTNGSLTGKDMTIYTEILYKNSTTNIPEFVLQGFPGIAAEYYGSIGTFFFFIYLMLASGNIFILVFVACEKNLQKPTYIIFCNLAISDLGFGTTTLPRIIAKYWISEIMSFSGCFTQMYFVHYFGTCTSFLMALMALDRFIAICNPLRYPVLITHCTTVILCSVLWIGSLLILGVITAHALSVTYCGPNVIRHCYCDYISISNLACADTTALKATTSIIAMTVLWGPLFFIIFSYVAIIISVMKISDKEGRYKTFLTCTPQLFIICLYYLPRSFVYIAFTVGFHFETNLHIAVVMMYSLFPALINPFIYCFRTKEIKDTLMKKFKQRQVRANQKSILS